MGFLRRLFSSKQSVEQSTEQTTDPDIAILKGYGEYALPVVAESFYQTALEEICGPRSEESVEKYETAALILEDDNPKDNYAVRVEIQGKQVGYLSRDAAIVYRQQIAAGGMPMATGECLAVIRGGWKRSNGSIGKYGVWLDIPVQES